MSEAKYQVSIVTPFHNVDLKMFRYAYESLQQQTLGFRFIQWIVVLHNTESSLKAAVHEMLDGHENIIITELDNDLHTPSSPRNFGMKLATAPFLGFLDADDGYTPECLQTALLHLQRTQSDLVVFRREYEMETEGLMPATEIVLWDQTQAEIVMDREHWDDKKMFGGLFWGMVTSRLYKRDFLTRHNFTFDETVPFTEDVLFLIEVYGKAGRVCYLPQLIGYHYFINSKSLVQSMVEKDGETLVSYAAGFKKIFDAAYNNGIYIDELMALLLSTFSMVMLNSKQLTLVHRREIKEILEPYVHEIRLLPVTKLISAEEARKCYTLPREVILHPENFDQGGAIKEILDGQGILQEILSRNKDTDYGRRYNFASLRSAQGYQTRVPVSSYDTYGPLVRLQTQIGESGIFVSDAIPCYLLTSGNSGAPKLLPATREHLARYEEEFAQLLRGKMTILLGESLPQERRYNDQAALNTIFGRLIEDFCYRDQQRLGVSHAGFTAPRELLFPPQAMDTLYLRLYFALSEQRAEQLFAPFAWGVLEAFSFLESHWQELVKDLTEGTISSTLDLPKDYRQQLERCLIPDPERAEALREIFAEGFHRPVATLIWPKLKKVIAIGTGSQAIYRDALRRYIGDLPWDNGFFASSEALLGKSVPGTDEYELVTGKNFYEFRPFPEKPDNHDHPLLLSQVQEGKQYELILTNRAGLYRYATEDILEVRSLTEGRLHFAFAGRKSEALPLPGGLLWEKDVYTAIKKGAKALSLAPTDFSYFLSEKNVLTLLLEVPGTKAPEAALAAILDQSLCEECPAYAKARREGQPPCQALYLSPESHLLYRDIQRFKHKTAPDQIKPAHFLGNREKIRFFMGQVER